MRSVIAAAFLVGLLTCSCSVDRSAHGPAIGLGAKAATCDAVEAVVTIEGGMADRRAHGEDLNFTKLVQADRPTDLVNGMVAMLSLGMRDVRYGVYGPAMHYLVQRNLAWTTEFEGEVAVPKRTAAVVASAKRLDHDLAAGMCPSG
ncbi:hypothetical protein KSP35_05710 [Aquihabitans sp. G128]|uniref:hypothetical protein n=1 Tax=Aquihabitans sp. G128 TaxID=2849779 RepID=UPI001C230886|nr:hypothetical protein [Aquihabitans sp. G128]QXC62300.1 hypothetical protein KSP35_05710 [Aquihabitans sp. G128]